MKFGLMTVLKKTFYLLEIWLDVKTTYIKQNFKTNYEKWKN